MTLLCVMTTNQSQFSILSKISKIFEKIIDTRLSAFLSINNVIYEKQFGFRNQQSINHALIEITEENKHGYGSGKFACRVFLD